MATCLKSVGRKYCGGVDRSGRRGFEIAFTSDDLNTRRGTIVLVSFGLIIWPAVLNKSTMSRPIVQEEVLRTLSSR